MSGRLLRMLNHASNLSLWIEREHGIPVGKRDGKEAMAMDWYDQR